MKRNAVIVLLMGALLLGCSNSSDDRALYDLDRKMNRGQYNAVIQEGEKYLLNKPDSFRGWNILGWAYLKNGQGEKAEVCFQKSVEINDQWDNAYVGMGVLYREMGEIDKARENYLKAISLVPDNAEAFSSLLVIEMMEGNDQKAIEYGEKAWALRKDLASIPANLAIAYHYFGNYTKRDEFYKYAKDLKYHNLQTVDDIFSGELSMR